MATQILVLATRNAGKVREFGMLLEPIGWRVITASEAGYNGDPEESGKTFEANAYLKAKEVSEHVPYPVLADDSGLEVDALEGEPGVYSARYAGVKATDSENRHKLLQALAGNSIRDAHFVCVLCFLKPQSAPLYFKGTCDGNVAESEMGQAGFGYDSIFIPKGFHETFAQMKSEVKRPLSHRGKAVASFIQYFSTASDSFKKGSALKAKESE